MIILAAALTAVVVVLCWLHARSLVAAAASERAAWHQTLTDERAVAQAQLSELLKVQATERDRWLEDRTLLLNRIKPETAQPVLHTDEVFAPPAIPADDDEAFWEDKEHMADRLAQTELELRNLAGAR